MGQIGMQSNDREDYVIMQQQPQKSIRCMACFFERLAMEGQIAMQIIFCIEVLLNPLLWKVQRYTVAWNLYLRY